MPTKRVEYSQTGASPTRQIAFVGDRFMLSYSPTTKDGYVVLMEPMPCGEQHVVGHRTTEHPAIELMRNTAGAVAWAIGETVVYDEEEC